MKETFITCVKNSICRNSLKVIVTAVIESPIRVELTTQLTWIKKKISSLTKHWSRDVFINVYLVCHKEHSVRIKFTSYLASARLVSLNVTWKRVASISICQVLNNLQKSNGVRAHWQCTFFPNFARLSSKIKFSFLFRLFCFSLSVLPDLFNRSRGLSIVCCLGLNLQIV